MKRNQGITLIALVITIIVLLILAGVAIAMLSGENGILKKAAEAKNKTEEGQKEEETSLTTMDLETYFLTSNLKYKCKYGYITGISAQEEAKNLKNILNNQGYKLRNIENTEDIADSITLKTGMIITKNGEEVARTVIFGDVDMNSEINSLDATDILSYCVGDTTQVEEYQKVAMDVNCDGVINHVDAEIVLKEEEKKTVNQNQYVTNPKLIKISNE